MTSKNFAKILLSCGIIAGPVYVLVGVGQILFRPGFDITKHALSIMSNGDLGWIQVSNFIICGLLVLIFAVGIRKALAGSRGGTWGVILIAIYGIGLIGAGIFKADPALGFPPGTPADAHAISSSGLMHFVFGGLGFYAVIAACFVFARRFSGLGDGKLKWFSIATGLIFLVSFMGIASGATASESSRTFIMLAFYFAVLLIWIWMSVVAFSIRSGVNEG